MTLRKLTAIQSDGVMNKVKGVTVLELLVTTMLISITMNMGYEGYFLFQKQVGIFQDNSEDVERTLLLGYLLKKDVLQANVIVMSNSGFNVIMENNDVNYQVSDGTIIRSYQTVSDTFWFDDTTLELRFEGIPTVENEPVDEVVLMAELNEQQFPFNYNKQYSIEQLMTWSNGD